MNNVIQLKTSKPTQVKEQGEDLKALARHLGRIAAKEYFESHQGDASKAESSLKSAVDRHESAGV